MGLILGLQREWRCCGGTSLPGHPTSQWPPVGSLSSSSPCSSCNSEFTSPPPSHCPVPGINRSSPAPSGYRMIPCCFSASATAPGTPWDGDEQLPTSRGWTLITKGRRNTEKASSTPNSPGPFPL